MAGILRRKVSVEQGAETNILRVRAVIDNSHATRNNTKTAKSHSQDTYSPLIRPQKTSEADGN